MTSPDPYPFACFTVKYHERKYKYKPHRTGDWLGCPAGQTFTAALLQGPTPAAPVLQKTFNQVPLAQLTRWAQKHTTPQDQFVLEASGNSFQIVRTLAAIDRKVLVPESCQMGKLKEAHANSDEISAVRIGKAYLAGTAKTVCVPDAKTQERRDWFHAHRKAVKRTTQLPHRLLFYLSDPFSAVHPGREGDSDGSGGNSLNYPCLTPRFDLKYFAYSCEMIRDFFPDRPYDAVLVNPGLRPAGNKRDYYANRPIKPKPDSAETFLRTRAWTFSCHRYSHESVLLHRHVGGAPARNARAQPGGPASGF
jgi:hypothetical protein